PGAATMSGSKEPTIVGDGRRSLQEVSPPFGASGTHWYDPVSPAIVCAGTVDGRRWYSVPIGFWLPCSQKFRPALLVMVGAGASASRSPRSSGLPEVP